MTGPVTQTVLHLPDELPYGLHGGIPRLLIGQIFLLIQRQQLVLKYLIGQLGTHVLDTFLREIFLLWVRRPYHHVDVRVVLPVVESGVPTKTAWRNFHSLGQLCLVRQQKFLPALTAFITKTGGVLPFQGVDEDPHRPGMTVELLHGFLKIDRTVGREQAVRPWTFRHIFQVADTRKGGGVSNSSNPSRVAIYSA